MTNDVEKIILENIEKNELTYAENKAYMLYKEIWNFLLYIKDENFDMIRISFSYKLLDDFGYIDKNKGLLYTEFNNNKTFLQYRSYYPGCTCHYINLLFNTIIDMRVFFKLITIDGFHYNLLDDTNPVLVCIDVKKEQIEKKINEVLLKNKILKLEK